MVTSSTYVCPFCGEYIDTSGQSKADMAMVLISIKGTFGEDIMNDTTRLNAILMDYAPNMVKERKLLINALKEGFLPYIKRYLEEENGNSEYVKQKGVSFLVSEMWIAENAAQYIVDVILRYLGNEPLPIVDDTPSQQGDSSESEQLIKGAFETEKIVSRNDLSKYSSIGYKAFASNKQIAEVDIPDNIRFLYPKAFMNCCSLQKVTLGKGVESIGTGVFDGCNQLQSIVVEGNDNFE